MLVCRFTASRLSLVAFFALSCSCAGSCWCDEEIFGKKSDVNTAPGVYEGYSVLQCDDGYEGYTVVGEGQNYYNGCSPETEDCRREATGAFWREHIMNDFTNRESYVGGSQGSCQQDYPGIWVSIAMNDWREMDSFIEDVAAIIVSLDLAEIVSIVVVPNQCPM